MTTNSERAMIILAGGTGDLGGRIGQELLERGAQVKALVRAKSANAKIEALRKQEAEIVEVDFNNSDELTEACAGGTCLVSALSGLKEVIVDVQTSLLNAAVAAGVPRFIPSDYSIDFTKLPPGSNRNLDLRREFRYRLDKAPIAATSIFNGMFMDLLTGQAPMILFGIKRVVYWGDANQPMDFTTIANTAAYTAAAALAPSTPRDLHIAGDVLTARGLKEAASEATGKQFHLLRAGGLGRLDTIIKITRTLFPQKDEVFPPWQGMQYMRNMFSGRPKLVGLDNGRYSGIQWTTVQELLKTH